MAHILDERRLIIQRSDSVACYSTVYNILKKVKETMAFKRIHFQLNSTKKDFPSTIMLNDWSSFLKMACILSLKVK